MAVIPTAKAPSIPTKKLAATAYTNKGFDKVGPAGYNPKVPTVKPHEYTGTHIDPEVFKQWLDEGKEVTILDTRNDYEVRMGTFEGAIDFDIESFRAFPKAVEE